MGAAKWHAARANYHLEVAKHLNEETEFADWGLVALYYSALHEVDSVLANKDGLPKDERHPRKHSGIEAGSRGRNQLVAAVMPRNVSRAYRQLEELSRRTRYDVNKLGQSNEVFKKAMGHFREVEKYTRMMYMVQPEIPTDAP